MSILFGKRSYTIVRGTAWSDDVGLTNEETGAVVSLVGIVGLWMRIREFIDSEILLELSMANGLLELVDPAEGIIGFRCATADTLELPENGHYRAVYLYDVLIERTSGEFEPALGGKLIVLPSVTRAHGTT